jgi:hypothetical protein
MPPAARAAPARARIIHQRPAASLLMMRVDGARQQTSATKPADQVRGAWRRAGGRASTRPLSGSYATMARHITSVTAREAGADSLALSSYLGAE